MSWFEDAKAIIEQEGLLEKEKVHHLRIEKEDDLDIDMASISSLSFASEYKGKSPISLLLDLIPKCDSLKEIQIFSGCVCWDELGILDLSNLEKLCFSMQGTSSGKAINAPNLKDLTVFYGPEQSPIQKQLGLIPRINYSGMPLLEKLKLSHFSYLDADDFQSLKHLKHLEISSSSLHTLEWLKSTAYQLESLAIDSPIASCFGVEFHPNLKWLALSHTKITDVTPIEKLNQLTHLDLRYLDLPGIESLRNKANEVLLTYQDGDFSWIKKKIKDLLYDAIRRLHYEDKLFLSIDELPDLRRKALIRSINEPLDIRLQRHVLNAYTMEIARISKPKFWSGCRMTIEEYKEAFCAEAYKYFPFLADYQSQR